MKNIKQNIIVFLVFYEIIYLILRYVFSMHWITSTIIATIIYFSIIILDVEYYFLPTNYRKEMRAMDKTMEEIKLKYDKMENELE